MRILLELSYLGGNYAGFQVQPNKPTVQSKLQDALCAVYGERLPVRGCSRTDAGVHAKQYFATYDTSQHIPTEKIPLALNSHLPCDIAVRSSELVPESFMSGMMFCGRNTAIRCTIVKSATPLSRAEPAA